MLAMLLFMYKITNITLHKIATCYDVVSTVIYPWVQCTYRDEVCTIHVQDVCRIVKDRDIRITIMNSFKILEHASYSSQRLKIKHVCEHVYLRTLIQVRERVRTCDVVLMIAEYTSLLVVLLISASAMSLVIVWGRKKLSSGDSPSTCKTVIKILSNIQHI